MLSSAYHFQFSLIKQTHSLLHQIIEIFSALNLPIIEYKRSSEQADRTPERPRFTKTAQNFSWCQNEYKR